VLMKYSVGLLVGELSLDDKWRPTSKIDKATWPKCIGEEITEQYKKNRWSDIDTPLKTEIATYIFILVATVISILLIWQ
jgi:hypothetical protein